MSNAFIACGFPVRDVDRNVQNYKPKTEEEKQKQKENLDSLDKIFKRGRTIGSIVCNNKPKNTDGRRKNVVYCIPCECGMVYFGETGQWFDAREQQHQAAGKKLHMKNVIAAHVQQNIIVMPIEK